MSLENRLKIGGSFFAILLGCFFGGFLFEILAIIHFLSILEVTIQISQSSVTPPSGDPGTEGTAKPPGLPDKVKCFLCYILSIVPCLTSFLYTLLTRFCGPVFWLTGRMIVCNSYGVNIVLTGFFLIGKLDLFRLKKLLEVIYSGSYLQCFCSTK